MRLITGFELLENTLFPFTHTIFERFKLFDVNPYDVEDLKFFLYCLETGNVLYW